MPDARTLKILTNILEAVKESREENQRLHAHTDVMLVEAISKHDADPMAHGGRLTDIERRLERLEGKHDDEKAE